MDNIFRTYKVKHYSNSKKLETLIPVVKAYRKCSQSVADYNWSLFYKNGEKFKDFNDVKHINTELSARYKQVCQTQVIGQLKSYIANTKLRYIKLINTYEGFDEQTKIKLLYVIIYFFTWTHQQRAQLVCLNLDCTLKVVNLLYVAQIAFGVRVMWI